MKKKTDNTKCHHVCRAMKTLSIAEGREEWCGHPGWIVWQFLSKLNILSIQPSNPTLGCYPRVTKISHTNLQWIFIATQFIISENLEWPKCPSAGEWLSKMRHVTHGGILSNPKEQTVDTCSNLDDTWGNYSERNMLTPQGYIPCDAFHMTFSKRESLSDRTQVRVTWESCQREDVTAEIAWGRVTGLSWVLWGQCAQKPVLVFGCI